MQITDLGDDPHRSLHDKVGDRQIGCTFVAGRMPSSVKEFTNKQMKKLK